MEEKIVIIGNGFDLRHFLPTKYDHLITILREIEVLDFTNLEEITFYNLFGNLFKEKEEKEEKEKNFYNKICEFYNVENIKFDSEKLNSIKGRLKENSWFQYLKTVEESKIETWIDFETEIGRVLKIILTYFDNFNNNFFDNNFKLNINSRSNFTMFDSRMKLKFFGDNLPFNILKNFNFLINRGNSVYMKCNETYILEIDGQLQYFKEKDFFDSIYYSLEEFTGIFNDYLICIVDKFYPNFKTEKRENFISKGLQILFDKVQHIYSFNYTNTFKNLYDSLLNDEDQSLRTEIVKTNYEEEQIHGYAKENWENRVDDLKMVLGVSEIDVSLKSHKLFQFTKYFQKLHKDTDYLFLKNYFDAKKFNKVRSVLNFYFWGHSLDVSDGNYIKEIFNYLEDERSSIKIFYHSISGKADQLKNLLNIIDKNIIENLMKDKRLIFLEATSENLFKEL